MQSFRATRGLRMEVVGRLFQLVKGERECKVVCSSHHCVPCPIVQNSHTIVPNCKERRGMWSNGESRRKRKTVWWTTDSSYHNKILLNLHDSHVVRQEPNLLTWDLILSVCLCAYATEYWSTWSKGRSSLGKNMVLSFLLGSRKSTGAKDSSIIPSAHSSDDSLYGD